MLGAALRKGRKQAINEYLGDLDGDDIMRERQDLSEGEVGPHDLILMEGPSRHRPNDWMAKGRPD